ncbi:MAG: AAA family ATPase [Acidobacteriota bacterium]
MRHVDYLSAVGGGAYVASSLVAATRREGAFPFAGPRSESNLEQLRERISEISARGSAGVMRLQGLIIGMLAVLPLLLLASLILDTYYGGTPGEYNRGILEQWESDNDVSLWKAYSLTKWMLLAAVVWLVATSLARGVLRDVRQRLDRATVWLLACAALVAAWESLPLILYGFHQLDQTKAGQGVYALVATGLAIVALLVAGPVVAKTDGWKRWLAVIGALLLGSLLPLVIIVTVADGLNYNHWAPLKMMHWCWIVLALLLGVILGKFFLLSVTRLQHLRFPWLRLGLMPIAALLGFVIPGATLLMIRSDEASGPLVAYAIFKVLFPLLSAGVVGDLANWFMRDRLSGWIRRAATAAVALTTLIVAITFLPDRPTGGDVGGDPAWFILILAFVVWLLSEMTFDFNRVSSLDYHRDTVSRVFNAPFHSPKVGKLELSNLGRPGSRRPPYLLLNLAQTAPSAKEAEGALESFIASPRFLGSESLGYCPTKVFEAAYPDLDLATAVAISSAGGAPNVEPHAPRPLASLLSLINVQIGHWVPSAARLHQWSRSQKDPERSNAWRKFFWQVPPKVIFSQILGRFGAIGRWVNLTDGSLADNLGSYELVRRRCRFIILGDASLDPELAFADLAALQKRLAIDFGVELEIGLQDLRPQQGVSKRRFAIGRLKYPSLDGASEPEEGYLIYLKATVTGGENDTIASYRKQRPAFPHAQASRGRFAEADFDAYHLLGRAAVDDLFGGESLESFSFEELVTWCQSAAAAGDDSDERTAAQPPHELAVKIAARECVLVTGSGLGAQADLPTWTELLGALIGSLDKQSVVDSETIASLRESLRSGRADDVAGELVERLSKEMIRKQVASAVGEAELSEAHRVLGTIPFAGAISTSFDTLVETAFKRRRPAVVAEQTGEELAEWLREKRFFVCPLFGTDASDRLLYTRRQVRGFLRDQPNVSQFLGTVFRRFTLLFVGFSCDGIRALLDSVHAPGELAGRSHFALVAEREGLDELLVNSLRRDYNVTVLDLPATDGFPEVQRFAESLRSAVTKRDGSSRRSGRPELTRVELENIGPFDELEVDFKRGWNILLGNNGVGKTIILRSIAAALCGDEADERAVGRLLKNDRDKGTIRVFDRGQAHVLELGRDRRKEPEIKSAPMSPLRVDDWLVMGFGPLRGVSWERPEASAEDVVAIEPLPSDVLPLLRGESDGRLNNLKQWIVNIDYRATARTKDGAQARKLKRRVFQLLNAITPGIDFELHSIDRKTREILLDTGRGIVPLEAISQGTASIFSWVGTLQQRLAEAAAARSTGEDRGALVLIDEIDAHMHPLWQQHLIPTLVEQFPGVQFVATTHSPMIVAGRSAHEVVRLRQDRRSNSILLERPERSLKGVGLNWILTSESFGLSTLLDLETQDKLDKKRQLAVQEKLTAEDKELLAALDEELEEIDYASMIRDPMYSLFVDAMTLLEQHGDVGPSSTRSERLERAGEILRVARVRKELRG